MVGSLDPDKAIQELEEMLRHTSYIFAVCSGVHCGEGSTMDAASKEQHLWFVLQIGR